MCETITKAYVPHNVGKEQGPLNLKVEERDLWGGETKKHKEHLAKAGRVALFLEGATPPPDPH